MVFNFLIGYRNSVQNIIKFSDSFDKVILSKLKRNVRKMQPTRFLLTSKSKCMRVYVFMYVCYSYYTSVHPLFPLVKKG